MASDNDNGRTISDYFNDVGQMLRVVDANAHLSDYGTAHKIVYFVDADVVAMFMNPASKLNYLGPFRHWLKDDQRLNMAILTAEFLFSGRLPGQNDDVVYVTPDHFLEIQNLAEHVRYQTDKLADQIDEDHFRNNRQRVAEMIEHHRGQATALSDCLQALSHLVPTAMKLATSAASEGEQLRRLRAADAFHRGDKSTWFHGEILRPNPDLVLDWIKRIRFARGARPHENLVHDATSIVQLLALNHDSESERDGRRYVLITGDIALHNAFNRYRRDERSKASAFPIVRHPREFIPMLNLGQMSGRAERRVVMTRLREAIVELMSSPDAGSTAESNLQRGQAASEFEQQSSANIDLDRKHPQLAEAIEFLRTLWSQTADHALALNIEYLNQRSVNQFEHIADLLSAPDLKKKALDNIVSVIRDLQNEHLGLLIQKNLRQWLEVTRERARKESAFQARRAPLFVRYTGFEAIIGTTEINQYLDALVDGSAELPAPREMTLSADNPMHLLFGACVGVAAEDWRSAQHLGDRARQLTLSAQGSLAELHHEAAYVVALCSRFDLRGKRSFDHAVELLENCVRYHDQRTKQGTAQTFRAIRAVSEHAALILVALFKRWLIWRGGADDEWPVDVSRFRVTAERLLNSAEDRLTEQMRSNRGGPGDKERYLRVGFQIYTNKLALWIHYILVEPTRPLVDIREKVRRDLKEVQVRIQDAEDRARYLKSPARKSPYPAQVFHGFLSWLVEESPEAKDVLRVKTLKLLERLLSQRHTLVDFDRAEYDEFRRRLLE